MKTGFYYIYMMTNKNNTVIYTGMTNNLERRVLEHKAKLNRGFTDKYNCTKLVYFENFQWVKDAIAREKQIKSGSRRKKEDLINLQNSQWDDLSVDWFNESEILAAMSLRGQL